MLIINNGAQKSGSSWVQNILFEGLNPDVPSDKWRNNWTNASINPDRLEDYIHSGEWRGDRPVVIKTHFSFQPKYKFLAQDGIKIVVSYRNIPDSVVSRYHHELRQGETHEKIDDWCERKGRQFAMRVSSHRLSWASMPETIAIRYEDMVSHASREIKRLFDGLGFPQSNEKCDQLARDTQVKIRANEKPRDGKHIRTAGQSRASEELARDIFKEFRQVDMWLPDLQDLQTGRWPKLVKMNSSR